MCVLFPVLPMSWELLCSCAVWACDCPGSCSAAGEDFDPVSAGLQALFPLAIEKGPDVLPWRALSRYKKVGLRGQPGGHCVLSKSPQFLSVLPSPCPAPARSTPGCESLQISGLGLGRVHFHILSRTAC